MQSAFSSGLLQDDPTNQTARMLLDQCAELLIAEAQAAQLQGDYYNARNLLEEVLAFHPNHPVASRLWPIMR